MLVVFCDGVDPVKPFILMGNGDLIALFSEMVRKRSEGTTRVTKVKGLALLRIWFGLVRLGRTIALSI